MTTITTQRDLRNWVDTALGADGDATIIDAVTDYLQRNDHPAWGSDWGEFLGWLDVWAIATGLGV